MNSNNEVSKNALKQGLACCTTLNGLTCRQCPYANKGNCIDKLLFDCFVFLSNMENKS